ncbi:MAG: DUF1156 domain-containing protein [Deltaproteobacteria bacterium]|nr:DUF1156 domain-containing protein [Deltaproteobacteria bacterium]
MDDRPRLIEVAFPLRQASLDSVHEKNVRHGHISTLHIWPARRPLAACRAALIATLLPDPGDADERKALIERLGGRVKTVARKKRNAAGQVETADAEVTEGGILHWGRESGPDLDYFRALIRDANGGRPPRVLDPFAGGGAIPLEAMRLGCEVTAADINPVAWFLLRCTLEYPQRLAGQTRPLPDFALQDREFMSEFLAAKGFKGRRLAEQLDHLQLERNREQALIPEAAPGVEADLAWHVRAWGRWVLARARQDLARFYPVIDGKPTVAYLWARTVTCKGCRGTVPLLKTKWLCRKDDKRVALEVVPPPAGAAERSAPTFHVITGVPVSGRSPAERREHDKQVGRGTMSRSGATCPCCGTIMTSEDLRMEGQAGRMGAVMTAVVVEGPNGKEYRLPVDEETRAAEAAGDEIDRVFADVPFGVPEEPVPQGASRAGGGSPFTVPQYGMTRWGHLFNARQLCSFASLIQHARRQQQCVSDPPGVWRTAIAAYLAASIDKLADYNATLCTWHITGEKMSHVFVRFALPISWDFAESNPLSSSSGNYLACLDWVARVNDHCLAAAPKDVAAANVVKRSAQLGEGRESFDIVVTDPPYYDAIPYSDLMDFFYVWLRRTLHGSSPEFDEAFSLRLGPKWDHERADGELIDDASRHGGDHEKSKAAYENGMARAFKACNAVLSQYGRLVVVFAHKQPDAWETLVSAIIRSGFVVDGSWPIQTEMGNRTRALSAAALSSSVWLVCRKRPDDARPGWDHQVLEAMRARVATRLRDFWDAGIRGPDFVWAATGPALEAYSRHPVVKKANEPGKVLGVGEFLKAVRRIVVDFVVGRVLSRDGGAADVAGLDDVTTYYLLHRHDFGMGNAPAGAPILYALSCNLSDSALADAYDILQRTGDRAAEDADDEADGGAEGEGEDEAKEGSGSEVRLKTWQQRRRKSMGCDAADRPAPLIDQVHRLMHLWKAGDLSEVEEYVASRGLRLNPLFAPLLQALIELAPAGSEERSMLESISNHAAAGPLAIPGRPRPSEQKLDLGGS